MKTLKNPLTVRGDALYCPLPLSLDSYGNCLTDCWHCYFRNLNHVWGSELKPICPEDLGRKLQNGLSNKFPKTPLANALAKKKTIRFGNKTDPFQDAELEYRVSREALKVLKSFQWETVVQTKFTHNLMEYVDILIDMKGFITVMPIISPGFDRDWELLERSRTGHPQDRLDDLKQLKKFGLSIGINGEPFIPGFHTVQEFEEMMKRLKSYGFDRYNVYNFHFNAFVAKRLHSINVDIERIWFYNQDVNWRPILQELLDIAKKYDIILGCPDFVNSGVGYVQRCNTCCGIDVKNPCTFNTHTWVRMIQDGHDLDYILENTWDGVGDYESGKEVLMGSSDKFFTISDVTIELGLGLI